MTKTTAPMPPVGTRARCSRCGRTVWLKKTGTMGWTSRLPGAECYEWCARKGTKPRPLQCPVSDGYPFTHHAVEGYATQYFGPVPE